MNVWKLCNVAQEGGRALKRVYYTAQEITELIGCSPSKAYSIIRKLNAELEKGGYIVVRGKVPISYFNEKCYGGTGISG